MYHIIVSLHEEDNSKNEALRDAINWQIQILMMIVMFNNTLVIFCNIILFLRIQKYTCYLTKIYISISEVRLINFLSIKV